MLRIAVIGCGHWGPNLIRNFAQIPECRVAVLCDLDPDRMARMREFAPDAETTTDWHHAIGRDTIDAAAIATPAGTHHHIAGEALRRGKHVFVEKPLTVNSADAEALVELARKQQRVLMVGHLMKYHPAMTCLKRILDSGQMGPVHYTYSQRLNFGVAAGDPNAMWSLAPHDISMAGYLLDRYPENVAAVGRGYLRPDAQDVVFMMMDFGGGILAHTHVSWLDPARMRRMTVVCAKQIAVFDDMDATAKLRIYDHQDGRAGEVTVPTLEAIEPVRAECRHFVECVLSGARPLSDGADGLRVVQVLEAADRSMAEDGCPVRVAEVRITP